MVEMEDMVMVHPPSAPRNVATSPESRKPVGGTTCAATCWGRSLRKMLPRPTDWHRRQSWPTQASLCSWKGRWVAGWLQWMSLVCRCWTLPAEVSLAPWWRSGTPAPQQVYAIQHHLGLSRAGASVFKYVPQAIPSLRRSCGTAARW